MSIQHLCKEFKEGRTDIHDDQRSGRPSVADETIMKMEYAMLKDRKITVRKLNEIPDVSKTSIDKTLTDDSGHAKVCARWVPRMFTEGLKWQRVEVAREFLELMEPMMKNFWTLLWQEMRPGPLHDIRNERTIPSVEASRVAEGMQVQTLCPAK